MTLYNVLIAVMKKTKQTTPPPQKKSKKNQQKTNPNVTEEIPDTDINLQTGILNIFKKNQNKLQL